MDRTQLPRHARGTAEAPADLLQALGITATYIGKNNFDYLIEVAAEDTVRNVTRTSRC